MLRKALYFFLVFLSLASYQSVFAHPTTRKAAPLTVYDYIQVRCDKSCVDPDVLMNTLREVRDQYGVDPKLYMAMISVESRFNRKARSQSAVNVGLAQVNLHYHAKKFERKSVYDTRTNLKVGAQILGECADRSNGNVKRTLRCYNGNGDPQYAKKVLEAKRQVNKLVDLDL